MVQMLLSQWEMNSLLLIDRPLTTAVLENHLLTAPPRPRWRVIGCYWREMGCKFVCLYLLMLVNASDLLSRILETWLLNWGSHKHPSAPPWVYRFFWLLQSDLKWDCCTKVSATSASSGSLTVIKAESVKLSFNVLIGHHTWLQHPISTLLIVCAEETKGDYKREEWIFTSRGTSLQMPAHSRSQPSAAVTTGDLGCISSTVIV